MRDFVPFIFLSENIVLEYGHHRGHLAKVEVDYSGVYFLSS